MAKKRRSNIQKRKEQTTGDMPSQMSSAMGRNSMDKLMRNLTRLMEEQDFESIDEAQAFMDKLLADGGDIPDVVPHNELEQAQELAYQAMETHNRRKRIGLAEKALEISADCVDAYLILAEDKARTLPDKKSMYEKAIAAGERVLGDEFEEHIGYFWGVFKTRPYMMARLELANCYMALGEIETAIEHYWEMLRLNPNDNQGVRDFLLLALLQNQSFDDIERLFEQYDDGMALWLYSKALLAFIQEGASDNANNLLQIAYEFNPHVAKYLLGKKKLPRRMPDFIGFGDENEAIYYAGQAFHLWDSKALAWLKKETT